MSTKHHHHFSISGGQSKPIGRNQKVKIYYLTAMETWVDLGIGSLFLVKELNPQTEEQEEFIQVQAQHIDDMCEVSDIDDEEIEQINRDIDQKIIIKFRFHAQNQYDKQNDSIIICRLAALHIEFAISFTDPESMNEFWEFLRKRNMGCVSEGSDGFLDSDVCYNLQMPDKDNLEEMVQALDTDISHFSHGISMKPEYLDALFELFHEFELNDDTHKLQDIHQIIRRLMLSGQSKLITMLVSDKYYIPCLGAFEYKRGGVKDNFRETQKKESTFKQVIEIKNESILEKIHLNYRMQFIKDSVIASYIDDSTTSTFNQLIMKNNMEIIDYVKDRTFIEQLGKKFTDNLSDSIKFIGELLSILTGMHFITLKTQIAEIMNCYNFMKVFFDALKVVQEKESDIALRTQQTLKLMEAITLLASENKKELISILFNVGKAQSAPTFMMKGRGMNSISNGSQENESDSSSSSSNNKQHSFNRQYLKQLSRLLISEDAGIQIQVVEVLRTLFGLMRNIDIETDTVSVIIAQLFEPCIEHFETAEFNSQFVNFVIEFFELFAIVYKWCPQKFRSHVIQKDMIVKLFKNSQNRQKVVQLALVKLVRSILDSDLGIVAHFIRKEIIEKTWAIYKQHERRPNLINSTFQDMMNYLLVQNFEQNTKLFHYFMDNFGEQLKQRQAKSLCFQKIIEKQKSSVGSKSINFRGIGGDGEDIDNDIAEEKYYDDQEYFADFDVNGDSQSHDSSIPDEFSQEIVMRKQLLKEKILRRYSQEEYDSDEDGKEEEAIPQVMLKKDADTNGGSVRERSRALQSQQSQQEPQRSSITENIEKYESENISSPVILHLDHSEDDGALQEDIEEVEVARNQHEQIEEESEEKVIVDVEAINGKRRAQTNGIQNVVVEEEEGKEAEEEGDGGGEEKEGGEEVIKKKIKV